MSIFSISAVDCIIGTKWFGMIALYVWNIVFNRPLTGKVAFGDRWLGVHVDRSQSLFYFVPQENQEYHSQAGSNSVHDGYDEHWNDKQVVLTFPSSSQGSKTPKQAS